MRVNATLNAGLPPIIITKTTKIFSSLVLGAIFPKPTVVKLLKVKYKEEIYLIDRLGPLDRFDSLIGFPISSARAASQPVLSRAST